MKSDPVLLRNLSGQVQALFITSYLIALDPCDGSLICTKVKQQTK